VLLRQSRRMAAPDGEERVLMTAQHIVRSLGTTDTMTDDMLQILSKFDHRFSSMNDMNKKQESTSSQDSDYYEAAAAAAESQQLQNHSRRPSSSNVSRNNTTTGSAKLRESRLDAAEDVVVRWDMGYSEQAKQQMIFECPEEEAAAYLEAVDEVQYMLDSLFLQNREPETQARAQNLLQLAMERLQEEFRHLLLENSRSVDPDWLFDSLAAAEAAGSSSFQHSFDDHDDAIAAEESSGDDNADEDVAPVATPAALVQQTTTTVVDLVHPDVVLDLGNIAQRMIAAKYQNECCQLYVNSRKTVLEESLYGLGVEKLSIDEVQKMPWETLEDKIKKWIQAMKVGVKVLFASEKLLCDQVRSCFVIGFCPFLISAFIFLGQQDIMHIKILQHPRHDKEEHLLWRLIIRGHLAEFDCILASPCLHLSDLHRELFGGDSSLYVPDFCF
jgi:exocyst complex protein 7